MLKTVSPLQPDEKALDGAFNLLNNCVGLRPGQSVLVVGEDHETAFFDPEVCNVVADAAIQAGATATIIMARPTSGPEDFPLSIAEAMQQVDHTIFLSRIGDQVRFCPLPGKSTKTMSYTQKLDYLRADFARVPYGLFASVNEALLRELAGKASCRIVCPNGTDLSGALVPINAGSKTLTQDFSVRLFPAMITPPLSAAKLSGTLSLGQWLLSTSTHAYNGSLVRVKHRLLAEVGDGNITRFIGDSEEVERIDRHFRHVGSLVSGNPYTVNSWHAGSNPKTFFSGNAGDNIERWSDIVYGSPRYTHFHTCGSDPGDIAISLIDATLSFDGEVFWDAGRLAFLDRPEIRQLLERYQVGEEAFAMRWDIGV